MNDFLFNPILKKHKSITGAIKINEICEFNLYVNKTFNIYDLTFVCYNDEKEQFRKEFTYKTSNDLYNIYTVDIFFQETYLYFYYFEFNDYYGKHYLGASKNLDVYLTNCDVASYQINVYNETSKDLSWYKGKVMYQILVDRFNKGLDFNKDKYKGYVLHENEHDVPLYLPVNGKILNNDFFGGTLKGIIEKIDYLKSLNVSILYLNPIFKAPSNHKYNTSDYLTIDPMYGTLDDFIELVNKLKEANISLILDGVFNHTGEDSIYFNKYANFDEIGAYQSKKSKYYNWYNFIEYPNKYHTWWGIETLPSVNQNSSFTHFITKEVLPKWLSYGVKGFRLDVVDEINESFLKEITKAIKNVDKDNIVIGEVWEDASNKISYSKRRTYFDGYQLDSVMNYPFKNAIIDYLKNNNLEHLVQVIRNIINNYPKEVLDSLMNILSTHDTVRILTEFSNVNLHILSKDEQAVYTLNQNEYYVARSKLKMASLILYTLPGVPCIYYGDEAGIEGFKDPFCRKKFLWDNIKEDIYSWYKLLGNIRKDKIFIDGVYQENFYENGVFSYSRVNEEYEYMIIVNNSSYDYTYNGNGYDIINDIQFDNNIIIYSQTSIIIKKEHKNEKDN